MGKLSERQHSNQLVRRPCHKQDVAHVYTVVYQACVIAPFKIAGASSPTTIAGIATQALAETLVGVASSVRIWYTSIYGFMMLGMSMRSGSPIRHDETWKTC